MLQGLGAGACFRETALTDLLPRRASVRAEQDWRTIEMAQADLARWVERDGE